MPDFDNCHTNKAWKNCLFHGKQAAKFSTICVLCVCVHKMSEFSFKFQNSLPNTDANAGKELHFPKSLLFPPLWILSVCYLKYLH